jgi:hypothetical protein
MIIQVDIYFMLQFLGGALTAAVFIFLIYRAYRGILSWARSREYDLDKNGIKKRWREIKKLLEQPGEMNYKLAVLEADKLLDYILKSMSMPGKDLGERLRFACFKYNRLKRVWWAHILRNQLAHEATFSLNYGAAKRAIKTFEAAFRELGAL